MDVNIKPLESAALAGDELISTPIGDIELRHSYFDHDASRRLFDEMDYQRACQAYIWGHPIVILRLYGPTEPALTRTWKPGDIAKMS